MIDAGEIDEAISFLEENILEYPNNAPLILHYGLALKEANRLAEAEVAFRKVLAINGTNPIAKNQIDMIRQFNNAAVSETAQQLENITIDKFFDLLTIAAAFALGTVFSTYIKRIEDWNFNRRSRKLFLQNRYDDFVDMLEIQISTNKLKPLRNSVTFMLTHKSEKDIIKVLDRYVNTEENFNTLVRMIERSKARETQYQPNIDTHEILVSDKQNT
ncbi:TPR domain protein [Glaciecola sp. KUL10]|nr:TPR domain protein [Glaciecola sp. KUL10]